MSVGSINIVRNPAVITGATINKSFVKGDWLDGSYNHESRAMGGFWGMEYSIQGSLDEMRWLMDAALGSHINSYSRDGGLAWEGFINTLTLNAGGLRVRHSLDSMVNRVWTRYVTTSTGVNTGSTAQQYDAESVVRLGVDLEGTGGGTRSTKQNDTNSQARYGIKERVISGGNLDSSGVSNNLASNYLKINARPKPTIEFTNQKFNPEAATLQFNCKGYFRTLNWRTFTQSDTGSENVSAQIDAVVSASGEFIASSSVETNTLQVPATHDADRFSDNVILDNARLGDSSDNRYIVGVYDSRKLIYKQQPSTTGTPKYTRRIGDNVIYNLNQYQVLNSLVRPGEWCQITGVFPYELGQYSSNNDNPSVVFIESVKYRERGDELELLGTRGDELQVMLAKASLNGLSDF